MSELVEHVDERDHVLGVVGRDVAEREGWPHRIAATHLARWRGHCLAQLGVPGAVEDAAAALDTMDRSFTRAEAGLRCDYATALVHAGEREEAENQFAQARRLAEMTGSARQLRRIEAASVLLA